MHLFVYIPVHVRLVLYIVSCPWVLFPPATGTLRADGRAVLCRPEDGRLTFERGVFVVYE